MKFYPEKSKVPEGFSTNNYKIRPLLITDVEKDYEAVMATQELNLRLTEGRWPKNGFSLEENLKDLKYHQQMHEERKEFTFTVMNSDETTCLGCIYFKTLNSEMINELKNNNLNQDYIAIIYFWLRPDLTDKAFADNFINDIINWINSEWEFSQVYYFIRGISLPEDQNIFLDANLSEKFKVGNTKFFA